MGGNAPGREDVWQRGQIPIYDHLQQTASSQALTTGTRTQYRWAATGYLQMALGNALHVLNAGVHEGEGREARRLSARASFDGVDWRLRPL